MKIRFFSFPLFVLQLRKVFVIDVQRCVFKLFALLSVLNLDYMTSLLLISVQHSESEWILSLKMAGTQTIPLQI